MRFGGGVLVLFLLHVVVVAASRSSSSAASAVMMSSILDHRKKQPIRPPSPTLLQGSASSLLLDDQSNSSHHPLKVHSHDHDSDPEEEDDENETAAMLLVETRGGAAAAAAEGSMMGELVQRLKIGFYFALWYALNIVYNIVNKKVLNVLPAPLLVGSLQFGVGALYVAILWLLRLRSKPQLANSKAKRTVRTVGFWHCVGQLLSMVSLGAGPVSFTHIVKALEPFFSALVAALYFGKWMHPVVYATLIPVVGGVGYACLKEKSFSWLAFGTAMGSNLAFALRAVLSKMAMTTSSEGGENPLGTNLTAPNMFGLVTCAAFWISIPLAFATEGTAFFQSAGTTVSPDDLGGEIPLPSLWTSAVDASEQGAQGLIQSIIASGLFHYLNNEVMYLALSNVHPVTLAVGNTMKRVFIMVASVMVFRNQITLQAGIGSAVGISGVLLYSLTKQYYETLEKQEAAKKTTTSSTPKNNKRGGRAAGGRTPVALGRKGRAKK